MTYTASTTGGVTTKTAGDRIRKLTTTSWLLHGSRTAADVLDEGDDASAQPV